MFSTDDFRPNHSLICPNRSRFRHLSGPAYEPIWQGRMLGWRPSVRYSIVCLASPTCSWRIGMRPLPRFVAPKVPGVRLVLPTLSLA